MRVSLFCAAFAATAVAVGCASSSPLTLADLPEHFEPVARLEDSMQTLDLKCRRPFSFTQDCKTEWLVPGASPQQPLHFPGVSVRAMATENGRVVAFLSSQVGTLKSGVRPSAIANYAYVAIERALREAGIAIDRTRAIRMEVFISGYLLETDGDAYTALKRASASAPLPPPPALAAVEVLSKEERPGLNPWGGADSALLVTAPPIVIDEARGFDAIWGMNCNNLFLFVQSCSNWTGPRLELAVGPVRARVAATRAGDVLMISAPSDFTGDFKRYFDPKITDPVNLSTRAVLAALRARGLEFRRVRAAVLARTGPVFAYIVELDRDGFSYLAERAAQPAPAK